MITTRTPPIAALVDDLDRAMFLDEAARPAAVALALQPRLGNPGLLAPCHRQSSSDRYRTNIVHVHPDGLYSVVALVWRPGQRTPIHSHAAWCVVGVHQGRELERSFRRHGDRVVEIDRGVMEQGQVTWLAAGEDDIHDVANAASTTTVSIHVYGLDYRPNTSSILRTYPEVVSLAA
jgi:3-mercaptopropionate dioxygenase